MTEPVKETSTLAPTLGPVRRVVTGHNADGRSIIVSDGPAPNLTSPGAMPGIRARVLWISDGSPASTSGPDETAPADLLAPIGPPANGTLLRVADFPPDSEYEGVDVGQMLRDINKGEDPRDGVPPESSERHFWFHKTTTLDYAIVLEGEVWALLDEGETLLRPGDILIQRGTSHAWSNRRQQTARVAFILIDAVSDGA